MTGPKKRGAREGRERRCVVTGASQQMGGKEVSALRTRNESEEVKNTYWLEWARMGHKNGGVLPAWSQNHSNRHKDICWKGRGELALQAKNPCKSRACLWYSFGESHLSACFIN